MDVREKLVELIGSTEYGNGSLVGNNFQKGFIEKIATHLIAKGVTVPKWISVTERLPEFCVSVLARCFYNGKWRTLVCHTSKEHAGEWYTDEICQWVKVTHWMPLPEQPAEENDYEID